MLIMSTRASICASIESGTCTAIWSPSKSALNAAQTSGCSWMALPSISTGSNAWMPRRCSVGARFSITGCSLIDLVEDVPDLGTLLLHHLLRALDGVDVAALFELVVDERLEQLERHLLRQTALVQLERRADDDDRAARVVDALAEQVLAEAALLALEHVAERLLSGRLFGPVMVLPRRPLSNSASTASCSMRRSLRMMISGAFSSSRRFRRLLRLMTRR